MSCKRISTIVNGLKKEQGDTLETQMFDALDPRYKAEIKGFGFENHGLVVFDSSGKVAHAENGHKMTETQIRSWVVAARKGTP